nr:ribosomal protein L6 [Cavernulicola chilensis]
MSRIGRRIIVIPEKVTITIDNQNISVKGPKGVLSRTIPESITLIQEAQKLQIREASNLKRAKQLHGLFRTLISNMVDGVSEGFQKRLEIYGVGFRCQVSNHSLILNVGFSHPIIINPPKEINVQVENGTSIVISGIDKEKVGRIASWIRSVRPPEPYKGKGIHYQGEHIIRKAGKAGKAR